MSNNKDNEKDNMFYGQLVMKGGRLQHVQHADAVKYNEFIKSLVEGQVVDMFVDANVDNGTLAQLAKIHKCIRELAKTLGYTFDDMKFEVKSKAGLCIKKEIKGEMYMVCKSFGKCSKDELGMAIETIIQMGDFAGMNFR